MYNPNKFLFRRSPFNWMYDMNIARSHSDRWEGSIFPLRDSSQKDLHKKVDHCKILYGSIGQALERGLCKKLDCSALYLKYFIMSYNFNCNK